MSTAENSTYPHELAGEEAAAPVQPTPDEVEAGRRILVHLAEHRAVTNPPLVEELRQAAAYRIAGCLAQGRAEADRANPGRDRRSDGWVGNLAHQARVSDHNPDRHGIVCALDLDVDGLNLPDAFERLRRMALEGRAPWLRDGYLILNRRITSPDFTRWNVYNGSNPHTAHGHASCTHALDRVDLRHPWGVFVPPVAPPLPPVPAPVTAPPVMRWVLPHGHWLGNMNGPARQHGGHPSHDSKAVVDLVRNVQQWLIRRGCVPSVPFWDWGHRWADGRWEAATDVAMRTFHRRFYPGQPYPSQCWADDYARLVAIR